MNTKISIIVPNYNHERFLDQRLESIFNQTFKDFEVILLDDASVDNSVLVMEKYLNHPKVSHFIVNKENSGSPFKQWEKGIDLAKGELIWIAESDDYCERTFLEDLINVIDENVVLSYSASFNINDKNEKLGLNDWTSALNKKRWVKDYRNTGKKEIKNFLRYRNTIPNASAVIFKKKSLSNLKFPVNMKFCGDWFLWLQILETGDIFYLSKPLNFFRKHSATTRHNSYLENEILRFSEYLTIVKLYNSFFHRIGNMKKFDWIVKERCRKRIIFGNYGIYKLGFPIDFIIRYYQICTKNPFKE